MKKLDYGKGYQYAHDFPGNFVEQEFLPEKVSGTVLFQPQKNLAEEKVRQRMEQYWGERYGYWVNTVHPEFFMKKFGIERWYISDNQGLDFGLIQFSYLYPFQPLKNEYCLSRR